MALLNNKKQYIRIKNNCRVDFYISEESRLRRKNATDSDVIQKTYQDKIDEQTKKIYQYLEENNIDISNITTEEQEELLKEHPFIKECADIANQWGEESYFYYNDFRLHHGTKRDFPLMKKIYSDVIDSIPEIEEMVFINFWPEKDNSIEDIIVDNLEELYQQAKKLNIFGETEDC